MQKRVHPIVRALGMVIMLLSMMTILASPAAAAPGNSQSAQPASSQDGDATPVVDDDAAEDGDDDGAADDDDEAVSDLPSTGQGSDGGASGSAIVLFFGAMSMVALAAGFAWRQRHTI